MWVIGLLHLSPNSQDAKDFMGTKGANTTAAPATAGNPYLCLSLNYFINYIY